MAAERVNKLDVLESDLRKVIKMKPDYAHAYNALGYTLADRTNRLAEAKELIDKAYKLAPDDPFILDSLGWVYFRLGNNPEALKYLQIAYSARSDPEIAAHLGEVLWTEGKHDEAQKIWHASARRESQPRGASRGDAEASTLKYVVGCVVALALAACATAPTQPLPQLTKAPQAFEVAGRIAVRDGQRSDIAKLRWTRTRGGHDEWVLVVAARQRGGAHRLGARGRHDRRGGSDSAWTTSFGAVTEKYLGVALDPDVLAGWIHGRLDRRRARGLEGHARRDAARGLHRHRAGASPHRAAMSS